MHTNHLEHLVVLQCTVDQDGGLFSDWLMRGVGNAVIGLVISIIVILVL